MEWLTAPSVDMSSDTRAHVEGGRVVAYGLVSFVPSDRTRQLAHLGGLVDPGERGRGIGAALMAWQIERARARLAEETSLPRAIRATTWEWIQDDRDLYERFGFAAVRRFDEMTKVLTAPEVVAGIADVEIVPWDRTRDEESLLANNAAFADHWGATPLSMGNWRHLVGGPDTRLASSFFALSDDRIVGMALAAHHPLDHQATGRREGWVRILSVDRDFRGRGIARALLSSCHNSFIAAGYSHSTLRVDAENLTGANVLYERVGYERARTSLIYEMEVT